MVRQQAENKWTTLQMHWKPRCISNGNYHLNRMFHFGLPAMRRATPWIASRAVPIFGGWRIDEGFLAGPGWARLPPALTPIPPSQFPVAPSLTFPATRIWNCGPCGSCPPQADAVVRSSLLCSPRPGARPSGRFSFAKNGPAFLLVSSKVVNVFHLTSPSRALAGRSRCSGRFFLSAR
jgi:hypothetical protein